MNHLHKEYPPLDTIILFNINHCNSSSAIILLLWNHTGHWYFSWLPMANSWIQNIALKWFSASCFYWLLESNALVTFKLTFLLTLSFDKHNQIPILTYEYIVYATKDTCRFKVKLITTSNLWTIIIISILRIRNI